MNKKEEYKLKEEIVNELRDVSDKAVELRAKALALWRRSYAIFFATDKDWFIK